MTISGRAHKESLALTHHGMRSSLKKEEILAGAATWMNLEDITRQNKPDREGHILCDSTRVRSRGQSDSWRQEAEGGFPGTGGGMGVSV